MVIISFQSNVRRYLVQKKFKERISAMVQLKKLSSHLKLITDLIKEIKDKTIQKNESDSVSRLLSDMEQLKTRIRCDGKMRNDEIKGQLDLISNSINDRVTTLKSKIKEQKRMKEMEEAMAKEKLRKEEERLRKEQEEDLKRRKLELEKKFEEENKNVPSVTSMAANQFVPTDEQMKEYNMRNQQEILDHDLAVRLSQSSPTTKKVDFGCQVSPVMAPKILSPPGANGWPPSPNGYKKYDLTKWKYSELRDTINTSCDIELLEECREEFHRRLRVYHEWKAKNQSAGTNGMNGPMEINDPFSSGTRAPPCIMQNAVNGTLRRGQLTAGPLESRFFRIPFVRPSVISGPKGWWFAHFEGQWIARQMELHPEKLPILLVAGQFLFFQSALPTKRGIEDSPKDFIVSREKDVTFYS